jgi:tetratricopeptide (TPR) repeat protein
MAKTTSLESARLRRLPVDPVATWEGGALPLPSEAFSPELRTEALVGTGWLDTQSGALHGGEVISATESLAEALFDALVGAAQTLGAIPARLRVDDADVAEALRSRLAAKEVVVELVDELAAMAEARASLRAHFGKWPSLLSSAGNNVETVRAFAEAAVAFHRARPWEHLNGDDPIRVESPVPDEAYRWLTILGAESRVTGIAFYHSREDYAQVRDGDGNAVVDARGARSLFFVEQAEFAHQDASDWTAHRFAHDGKSGFPLPVCIGADGVVRRPDARELVWLEGLVRTIGEATETELDSGAWTREIVTIAGPEEYRLTLPDVLDTPPPDAGVMPDRRSMEGVMRDFARLLSEREFSSPEEMKEFVEANVVGRTPPRQVPRTAADRADLLLRKAFDSRGRRQLALARKALEEWPDCADALILLAERTSDFERQKELYRRATDAGARAIPTEVLENDVGHFWGILETRPYMRARFGYAQCLLAEGLDDDAASELRELLRLNPDDNQGVRTPLLGLLLRSGDGKGAAALLSEFAIDDSALFEYARALVAFRKSGDSPSSRARVRAAVRSNGFVLDFLLGDREFPPELPDAYAFGSAEEAVLVVDEIGDAWEDTPGALDWVRTHGVPRKRGAQRKPPRKKKRAKRKKR